MLQKDGVGWRMLPVISRMLLVYFKMYLTKPVVRETCIKIVQEAGGNRWLTETYDNDLYVLKKECRL